jgi:hypothetical protein
VSDGNMVQDELFGKWKRLGHSDVIRLFGMKELKGKLS